MSHDDFEVEPIAGLPACLPDGEVVLWQGCAHAPTVARRVMHLDLVVAYVGLVLGWRVVSGVGAGHSTREVALGLLPVVATSLVACALLAAIAWAIARTTMYTITDRRVVMRIGVALPVTFNIPFSVISGAGLRDLGGGRGDIALRLLDGNRIAYLVLWPHVRPWRLNATEPMLRAIPDAQKVAMILSDALAAELGRTGGGIVTSKVHSSASEPGRATAPTLVAAE